MDENKDLENLTAEEQTKPVSLPGEDALGSGSPAPNKKLPIVIAVIAVLVVAVVLIAVFATRGRGNKGGAPTTREAVSGEASSDSLEWRRQHLIDEVVTDLEGNTVAREQLSMLAEVTTRMPSNVGSQSSVEIDAGKHDDTELLEQLREGATVTVTQPNTADKQQADAAVEQIKAFMDLTFYMDGAFYGDGMGTSTEMAVRGEDYEITANLDGIEIGIMKLGDKMYMKRIATKQYVEMSDAVLKLIGMNAEDLAIPLEKMDFDATTPVSVYDVTIGGKKGVCYTYANDENLIKFYAADGDLKQVEIVGLDGKVNTTMEMKTFSTTYPADVFTLKGYTSSTIGDMLADVMMAP